MALNNKPLGKKRNNKTMAVALALGVSLGVSMFNPALPTTQVEASSYSYSADQLQALATLNEYRKEAGMNPVTLDPFLTKAASNHYAYLNTNGGAYGHSEVKGHKGFTGVTPKDRVKAVGGSTGQLLGENIVFQARNSPNSVYQLVHNAPLHRESLLNPDIQSVGFAVEKGNQKGAQVIVMRVDSYEQRDSDHVYPVPNMKNVNPLFAGNEIPNPLKDYGIDQSGHILTYWYPSEAFIYDESDFSFVLKDSKGNVVPAFVDFKRNQASRLIPKKMLKYNETYTATVKWYSPDNNQRGGRTWSFTTMANSTTPVKPTTPPVTSVKESKDYTVIKGQPLYASNSTKSKQLVQIPTNGKVRSIEKRSSWMKVTYNGKTGWVAVKNLKAYVAPKTESKYANKNMKAYTTRSTKGKVAFTVPKGKKVTSIAVNGSWSQISYNGKTGWVASSKLTTQVSSSTSKAVEMKTKRYTSVYSSRSTKSKLLFKVKTGYTVKRTEVNRSWFKITYNGKTGWVASSNLATLSTNSVPPTTPTKPPATSVGVSKTYFGSHTYGVDTQAEYDAVYKRVKAEFDAKYNSPEFGFDSYMHRVLNGERGNRDPNSSEYMALDNSFLLDAEDALTPYFNGDMSLKTYEKMYRTNKFLRYVHSKYKSTDVVGDKNLKSAYDVLFRGKNDCDSLEQVKSLVYDLAGIDNAIIGDGVTHAALIFKVDEGWMGSAYKAYSKKEVDSTNALNIYISHTQGGKKISY